MCRILLLVHKLSAYTHATKLFSRFPQNTFKVYGHDTSMPADSDALVIQASSAFSLLALELATASRAFLPPYISLDGPWWPLVG
jgi:hypothetical protein